MIPASLDPLKEAVSDFLTKPDPKVIAIKGKWGTGKTYTWQKIIELINKSNALMKERYAYVSLFGVDSLDKLQFSIFEKTVGLEDINGGVNAFTFGKNLDLLKNGVPSFHRALINFKGWGSIGSIFKDMAALAVKDLIICFDDFERKSDKVSTKDILGLVSNLKEHRNCKIALIINHDALGDEDLEAYQKFVEKVVDIEIEFNPTATECAALAFDKKRWYTETAIDCCIKLNVRNIRLLQRIINIYDKLDDLFTGYGENLKLSALITTCIMVCSYFDKTGHFPDWAFILKYNRFMRYVRKEIDHRDTIDRSSNKGT